MSDNNSNATVSTVLTVMSEEQAATVLSSLRTLHALFGADLGSFAECGETEQKEILSRAHTAIGATSKAKRVEVVKSAKKAVDAVIAQARKEYDNACAEIAKLSPATRAMMQASLPEAIKVPLSDLADAFPAGMSKTDIVAHLHQMNYKLAQGKSKEGPAVLVNVKPELSRPVAVKAA